MKKGDIFNLVNNGILDITANELDAAHAYKVVKFKRAIKNAFDGIVEAEKDMLAEVKIDDATAFDDEMEAWKKSGENPEKLSEMEASLKRLNEMRANVLKEEAELGDVKTMPYEQFHLLQRENARLPRRPLNAFEELLEGCLWAAPESE